MKRYIYQETTQWAEPTANHIYIFTERPTGRTAKCYAYLPAGKDRVQKFKKPYTLDLKGRTFEELTA